MSNAPIVAYVHVYYDREGGGSLTSFNDAKAAFESYKTEVEDAYDTPESAFYTLHADGTNTVVATGGQFGPLEPAAAVAAVREALSL